jgi:hypothetical protein
VIRFLADSALRTDVVWRGARDDDDDDDVSVAAAALVAAAVERKVQHRLFWLEYIYMIHAPCTRNIFLT